MNIEYKIGNVDMSLLCSHHCKVYVKRGYEVCASFLDGSCWKNVYAHFFREALCVLALWSENINDNASKHLRHITNTRSCFFKEYEKIIFFYHKDFSQNKLVTRCIIQVYKEINK